MSITKEFYVELDLKQATGNRDFTLVEGDTGNIIHVTLCDDGTPVDLTDCRVLAVFTKPTGSSMQDSAIADGGVTIGGADGNEVNIDLFAASFGVGTNACELQIYSGTERDVLVTSAAFNFYCRNGIIDDGTIRSTDEYPLLTSLIRQVQAIDDSVLTPSDVDAGLSATSENPVQNKAVKEALDGKAASAHTHRKADVTDFSHTHTASEVGAAAAAHTHTKSDVTDFAHTHGNLTSDGKLGTTENLPVFTGTDGAVGVKTAVDARSALGVGELLWEGSWTSGSITVPRFSEYKLLAFVVSDTQAGIPVFNLGTARVFGGAVVSSIGNDRQTGVALAFDCSGNTLTMVEFSAILHNATASHTAKYSRTVSAIYGIC